MGAASAAIAAPLTTLQGCGGGGDANAAPEPIPPSKVVLHLPADMYRHPGAPTEWWWHIGTLKAGNRTFGFEINAASFVKDGFAFSQVMLTDVENKRHYQHTVPFLPPMFNVDTWAEADPLKPWSVNLGDEANHLSAIEVVNAGSGYTSGPAVQITGGGGSGAIAFAIPNASGAIAAILILSPGAGYTSTPTVTLVGGGGNGATAKAVYSYIAMKAPQSDPTKNMTVKSFMSDQVTGTEVLFDLTFSQQGPPFFVWGTGINPEGGQGTVQTNNFYFSLTRLQAGGSITIDGVKLAVSGVTWMDHEYGAFGSSANPVKWFLQDMQLDNGVCISNYSTPNLGVPELNKKQESHCTIQGADGTTWFVESFVTPIGRTWKSPKSGVTYFMQFHIEIPSFNASIIVDTPVDDQEFPLAGGGVYEGIATASGTFQYRAVTGTAWNEQAL